LAEPREHEQIAVVAARRQQIGDSRRAEVELVAAAAGGDQRHAVLRRGGDREPDRIGLGSGLDFEQQVGPRRRQLHLGRHPGQAQPVLGGRRRQGQRGGGEHGGGAVHGGSPGVGGKGAKWPRAGCHPSPRVDVPRRPGPAAHVVAA